MVMESYICPCGERVWIERDPSRMHVRFDIVYCSSKCRKEFEERDKKMRLKLRMATVKGDEKMTSKDTQMFTDEFEWLKDYVDVEGLAKSVLKKSKDIKIEGVQIKPDAVLQQIIMDEINLALSFFVIKEQVNIAREQFANEEVTK